MNYELVYTSVPDGLNVGARGLCTVACTDGMPRQLVALMEKLSVYRSLTKTGPSKGPVVYSHLRVPHRDKRVTVVSRIGPLGVDFQNKPNKLAHHHVFLLPSDFVGGPASLLARPDLFLDRWDGEPRRLPPQTINSESAGPQQCFNWLDVTGDAGWVSPLLESYFAGQIAYLIVSPEMPVLDLIDEALRLLPESERWNVTFSTYYVPQIPGVECRWRCVLAGSREATDALRHKNAYVIDLTRNLGAVKKGRFVANAQQGTTVAVPAPSRRRNAQSQQKSTDPRSQPSTSTPADMTSETDPNKARKKANWLLRIAVLMLALLFGAIVLLALNPGLLKSPLLSPLMAQLQPLVDSDGEGENPDAGNLNEFGEQPEAPFVAPRNFLNGDVPLNVNAREPDAAETSQNNRSIDPADSGWASGEGNQFDLAGGSGAEDTERRLAARQGDVGNPNDVERGAGAMQIEDPELRDRLGDRMRRKPPVAVGGEAGAFEREGEPVAQQDQRGDQPHRGPIGRRTPRTPLRIAGGGNTLGVEREQHSLLKKKEEQDGRRHPNIAGVASAGREGPVNPARPAEPGNRRPSDARGRRAENQTDRKHPTAIGQPAIEPGRPDEGNPNAGRSNVNPQRPPSRRGSVPNSQEKSGRDLLNLHVQRLPPIETVPSRIGQMVPLCRFKKEVASTELRLSLVGLPDIELRPDRRNLSRWVLSKDGRSLGFIELQSVAGLSELKIGAYGERPVPRAFIEDLLPGALVVRANRGTLNLLIPFGKPPVESSGQLSFQKEAQLAQQNRRRGVEASFVAPYIENQLNQRKSKATLFDVTTKNVTNEAPVFQFVFDWSRMEGTATEKQQVAKWFDSLSVNLNSNNRQPTQQLVLDGYRRRTDEFNREVALFLRNYLATKVRQESLDFKRKKKNGDERFDPASIRARAILDVQRRYRKMAEKESIAVPVINTMGKFTSRPSIDSWENLVPQLNDQLRLEMLEISRMLTFYDGGQEEEKLLAWKRERGALKNFLDRNQPALQEQLAGVFDGLVLPVVMPHRIGQGHESEKYNFYYFGKVEPGNAKQSLMDFMDQKWQ